MLKDSNKQVVENIDKNKITWGPLWAISLTVGIYLVTQVIAVILFFAYYYLLHSNGKEFNNWLNKSIYAQFFYVLIIEIQSVGIVLLFLRWKKATIASIGLVKVKAKDILYSLCGFGVYILIFYATAQALSSFVKSFNINQQQNVGFQTANNTTELVLTFFSLVVLPPIAEEIIFRGFLFGGLRKKMKFVYATLLVSVIFAIPHLLESQSGGLLWVAGLDTFTLSVVSCFLREKTKTLWPSIIMHSLKNFLAFSVIFLIH